MHALCLDALALNLVPQRANVAQAHQARLLAQTQHLHKQACQCIKMNGVEITHQAVVRLLVASEYTDGGIFPAGHFNPARGGDDDPLP